MQIDDIKPSAYADRTNAVVSDPGITYNETGITYNQVGLTYGGVGVDGQQEVFPIVASMKNENPHAQAQKSNAVFSDPGITYNEAGVTYNDSRYTYGGVGVDGQIDVFPITASIKQVRPYGFIEDIPALPVSPNAGIPYGLLLALTYPT